MSHYFLLFTSIDWLGGHSALSHTPSCVHTWHVASCETVVVRWHLCIWNLNSANIYSL